MISMDARLCLRVQITLVDFFLLLPLLRLHLHLLHLHLLRLLLLRVCVCVGVLPSFSNTKCLLVGSFGPLSRRPSPPEAGGLSQEEESISPHGRTRRMDTGP